MVQMPVHAIQPQMLRRQTLAATLRRCLKVILYDLRSNVAFASMWHIKLLLHLAVTYFGMTQSAMTGNLYQTSITWNPYDIL